VNRLRRRRRRSHYCVLSPLDTNTKTTPLYRPLTPTPALFSVMFALKASYPVPCSIADLEEMHDAWKESSNSSSDDDQDHLHKISSQISSLETNLEGLKEQAKQLPSLSPSASIQLDKLENR
jgi:hypothetical protein